MSYRNPAAEPMLVPGAEPYLIPGNRTACLLMHGFSAFPSEMRPLGDFLAAQGYTVLGLRFAGHASHPADMSRIRWDDLLANVEDGLAVLRSLADRVFLIGQSMGGVVALYAAARYPVAGVITLSTPAGMGGRPNPLAALTRRRIVKDPSRKAEYLRLRAEPAYPAYPWFPYAVTEVLGRAIASLDAVLPEVRVPALLMHSDSDQGVPVSSLAYIHDRIGSTDKQAVTLHGMDHSLVQDPQRQQAFEAIAAFLAARTPPA